ncbi:YaaC family protein [Bacteroidota bacterium]
MNKIWNELLGFETRDIVERYIKKRFNRKLSEERILQIASNFIQGREYFKSSQSSSITVRPLLQYYGVMALSKGLILSLDLYKTEAQLKGSHGLEVKNWKEILKKRDFENIEITVRDGTFTELLEATQNKNYLRANSSHVNYGSSLKAPRNNDKLKLKKLIQYFPDLNSEYSSWLDETLHFAILNTLKNDFDNKKVIIELQGKVENKTIELLFPIEYCPSKEITFEQGKTLLTFDECDWYPNITQRWHGAFDIGDACIIPTLHNDIGLNLLGGIYMISYVFGMMARYHPSTWMALQRIEKGDKIYPFVHRILEFIDDKYPRIILDFLKGPYDFENT